MRTIILIGIALLVLACSPHESNMKTSSNIKVSSTFSGMIPVKYTCDGEDINPELKITNIPDNAKSLAILVYDPDANDWVHWIAYNIKVNGKEKAIKEGFKGEEGINTWGTLGYKGPCPPEKHRYFFEVYALDDFLNLKEPTMKEIKDVMKGHILAKGRMIGEYER